MLCDATKFQYFAWNFALTQPPWLSDSCIRLAWLLIIFIFFVHFCLLIWVGFHVGLNKSFTWNICSHPGQLYIPGHASLLQDLSQLGIAGCISKGVCVNKIISTKLSCGRSEWLMFLTLIWQDFKRRLPLHVQHLLSLRMIYKSLLSTQSKRKEVAYTLLLWEKIELLY